MVIRCRNGTTFLIIFGVRCGNWITFLILVSGVGIGQHFSNLVSGIGIGPNFSKKVSAGKIRGIKKVSAGKKGIKQVQTIKKGSKKFSNAFCNTQKCILNAFNIFY